MRPTQHTQNITNAKSQNTKHTLKNTHTHTYTNTHACRHKHSLTHRHRQIYARTNRNSNQSKIETFGKHMQTLQISIPHFEYSKICDFIQKLYENDPHKKKIF